MSANDYSNYTKITLKCADDAKLRAFWAREVYDILIDKLKYDYDKTTYLTVHDDYNDYKIFRGPDGDDLFIDRDLFTIWFDELKAPSLYQELLWAAAKEETWKGVNIFVERTPEIEDHVRLKYLGI